MKPKSELIEVFRMSWPVSVSMLGATILQFIDGLMVSRTGPTALAAQFMGGMVSFIPAAFAMGLLTVVNTYVSQNLGAGKPKRCGQYAWAGMGMMWVYSAAMLLLIPLAEPLFRLLPLKPDVALLAVMYFRYIIVALAIFLSSRVLEQFFFGIHRPRIVLASGLVAILFNIGANYVLIFGKFGFPAMGLEGAAIGTVASTALRLVLLLVMFLRTSIHSRFATRSIFATKFSECVELARVGWPSGVQFCNGMLAWSVFVGVLVSRFGTAHLAANTAVHRYMSLAFMPAVGLGIATTAMVGRCIGAGQFDQARRRVGAAVLIGIAYTGLCGLMFFLFRRPMIGFFVSIPGAAAQVQGQAETIIAIGEKLMICSAFFLLFDGMSIVMIGALRGAGDTTWPMVAQILMSWTLLIGGGAIVIHFFPHLESLGPWIVASVYICIFALVMSWRFASGAWRKIDLLGRRQAVETIPAEPMPGVPEAVPGENDNSYSPNRKDKLH